MKVTLPRISDVHQPARFLFTASVGYFCVFSSYGASAADGDAANGYSVCGPNCALQVLVHYKVRDADLLKLVGEMQNGNVAAGCTLHDIKSAIAVRKIEAYGVD